MKCAIIVNSLSGNSMLVDVKGLTEVFGEDADIIYIKEDTVLKDLSAYQRIVACGGDGTLNSVINCKLSPSAQLFYLPYGTFNESQHNATQSPRLTELGKIGKRYFSYVCAAGIFTPLGYTVSPEKKKRYKRWAYFSKILKEYRVHRIKAQFSLDGKSFEGEYALLMAIDSQRCFGFKFNKMYRQNDGLLHFLAIKAPSKNGFLGAVQLFFPLFRTFFVGFNKPHFSKNIIFCPVKSVQLNVERTDFNVDGEKITVEGKTEIKVSHCRYKLEIVNRAQWQQMQKQLKTSDD